MVSGETFRFQKALSEETRILEKHGGNGYQVTDRYLLKNGKPWLPASGEIHYSRLPRELWSRELDKMKAAGLEIISTYIFWIHHEEIENEFRWDGSLNLGEFIDLCHEKGLEVSLRIGPWSHGECRNGGFPDWLLKKCGKNVRCNAEPYMTYVRQYYERIVEHLNGRRLFSIQIENELVSDVEHLERLYDLAKECGFEASFFTATAWGFDMSPLYDKMLPTFGGYPEQPWNHSTKESWPNPHFFFTGIRSDGNIGNDLMATRDMAADTRVPYFTCETGPGVQPYKHRRPVISAEDALSMAVDTLGDGCNWLGFYMFHGGINPVGRLSTMQESTETGYPNDLPVISYDFQAPIGEAGYIRESYYRLQSVCCFLQSYGEKLAPMISLYPDRRPSGLSDVDTLRCCLRSDGREGFLFVNNHHHGKRLPEHRDVKIKMEFEDGIKEMDIPAVPTDACFFLPVNLQMTDTLRLEYALAQPVSADGNHYLFEMVDGMEPLFVFSDGTRQVIRESAVIGDIQIHVRRKIMPKEREGSLLPFEQRAEYKWKVKQVPEEAGMVSLSYYGNKVSVYWEGKPTADQYYYGEPLRFYKPRGIRSLDIEIEPLTPEAEVYMECEARYGGGLESIRYMELE